MLNVWGYGFNRKIIHAFVKTGVAGKFDTFSVGVIPENILGGIGYKAKENAFACAWFQFGFGEARRTDPDTAAKGAESCKVFFLARGEFVRGESLVLGRESILDANVMVECIRPEARIKAGTDEEGTEGVGHSKVGAFNRTVLMGSVSASWS